MTSSPSILPPCNHCGDAVSVVAMIYGPGFIVACTGKCRTKHGYTRALTKTELTREAAGEAWREKSLRMEAAKT